MTGKMGCIPHGCRTHHARQLYPGGLCRRWKERPHLCGGHGGSERKGPLDELPVQL
jgi:hypothetical protein